MTNDVVERLLTDFYVSKAYDPRAERPADTVKAAIAFTIEALAAREGEGRSLDDGPVRIAIWNACRRQGLGETACFAIIKDILAALGPSA